MEENRNFGVNPEAENTGAAEQNPAPVNPAPNPAPVTPPPAPNPTPVNPQQNMGYNPPPVNPQQNMGYNPPPVQPKKDQGMAIASMVLGICSLVLGCCLWFLALPCAIVGVCLGAVSLQKKKDGRGMAIAGLVTSCICIAFLFIALIYISVAGTSLADMFKNYNVSQL